MAEKENHNYTMLAIVAIVAIVGIVVMFMNSRASEVKTADYSSTTSENAVGDMRRSIEQLCASIEENPQYFQTDHRGVDSWYTVNC